ncbi:uncharacterized protein LOC142234997 [Haematobia irritans]|uniref:uncharacterized protein LOC142234997 n=1 Tax=Haematobia irritans TaxID=7368 RepID=UPI003F5092B7
MNLPANFWDNYKTRNILSLNDRVRVLRAYDSYTVKPSYQSMARKFDCSAKQIKNIIVNRESILRSYHESSKGKNGVRLDNMMQKRQEKIEFLGKVMYEYIQRVLYHKYPIDDEKVRQKALQIKECIAVENFQPTHAWLEDFKKTYGIPAFDWDSLSNNVPLVAEKRPHLSAIDMIQYVSQLEQEERDEYNKSNSKYSMEYEEDFNADDFDDGYVLEPKVVYEKHDDDDEDIEIDYNRKVVKLANNSKGQEQYRVNMPPMSPIQKSSQSKRPRSSSPLPDIESVDEALRHIKALEEYSMLQDNFRAIGLLTQLEEIFKKHKNNK